MQVPNFWEDCLIMTTFILSEISILSDNRGLPPIVPFFKKNKKIIIIQSDEIKI